MTGDFWRNAASQTVVDVQLYHGGPWLIYDPNGSLDAPSGGGQSPTSRFGRDSAGNPTYQGFFFTDNPARVTATLSSRLDVARILAEALEVHSLDPRFGSCDCDDKAFNVRVRRRCGDMRDLNNYDAIIGVIDAVDTSGGFSAALAMMDETGADVNITASLSAGLQYVQKKLTHSDVSGSITDVAVNKIRHKCGKEWGFVTDSDSTPGYQSIAAPLFHWTTNDWQSGHNGSSYIDVFLSGNALDFVYIGGYVLAVSPTNGVARARYQDLIDGVANPWSLVSLPSSSYFPNAIFAIGNDVYTVADGGFIAVSHDGGFSFEASDAASATTDNLTSVFFESEFLGWAAGANGTLLRYLNGNWSVVTVSGLSATINTIAVPPTRANEVYLGTANGLIYKSLDAKASTPTFESVDFDKSGNGAINDLQFAGYAGQLLYILQSEADDDTRVLRDNSGGYLRNQVEVIGAFVSPENNGINSIALGALNFGFTAGEVFDSFGFIGQLSGT